MIKNRAFTTDQAIARHAVKHKHFVGVLRTKGRTMQGLFIGLKGVKRQDTMVLGDSYSSVSQNAIRAQKLGALETSRRRRRLVLAVCAV